MTDNWYDAYPPAKDNATPPTGATATPTTNWYDAYPAASSGPPEPTAPEVKPFQAAPDKTPTWSDMLPSWLGGTGTEATSEAFNRRDPRLALAAKMKGTTPEELGSRHEGYAGEFASGVPLAGAAMPHTEEMKRVEKEHPWGATAARMAGTAVAMAPLMEAAPGAFGVRAGQSFLPALGASAATNASLSAADTALRGGNQDDVINSALWGGGLGAGLGVVAPRVAGTVADVGRWLGRSTAEAHNPTLGSDRDILEGLARSNLTPQQLQAAVIPDISAALVRRGFTGRQIAQLVQRGLEGESPTILGTEFGLSPSTVRGYIDAFRAGNITPMNAMDLAEEVGGPGGSKALTRLANSRQIISGGDVVPAQRLFARQREQAARATRLVDQALPNPSTATEVNASQRAAQAHGVTVLENEYPTSQFENISAALRARDTAEGNTAYAGLRAQPNIIMDNELAEILGSKTGAAAYDDAVEAAANAGKPIPTRDELLKTFGMNKNPGLGINLEGSTPGPGLAPEAKHNIQQLFLDRRIAKLEEAADLADHPIPAGKDKESVKLKKSIEKAQKIADPELLEELKNLREGLGLSWETKSTGRYPQAAEPSAEIPVNALIEFQKALTRRGKNYTDPMSFHDRAVRDRLINKLDPENATPPGAGSARPSLVPGYRQTLENFGEGKRLEELMDDAQTLKFEINPKTVQTLSDFDRATPAQQEAFRLSLANRMRNDILNDPMGSESLGQWNTPNSERVIDHIFGRDRGARIREGLASARLTADAMPMGETLAVNLGTADAREALRVYGTMSPEQQELFKRGFSTKLRNLINSKKDKLEVVSQFNNENSRQLLRALLPSDDAEALIKGFGREEIGTGTKNSIYGGSKTAETQYDINENMAKEAARTVRHAATGKFLRIIDDWGNVLARQIGQQRATQVVRDLTEMDPPAMLRFLDRLIDRSQTDTEANTLYQMRRQIGQSLMGRAGTIYAAPPHAKGGAVNDHAARLNEIENGPHSPQEKRDLRRKVIQDALLAP